MAAKHSQTMSLWSVIEKMQSRLEAEGMDRDVVDAAVATGLQALLDFAPPARVPPSRPLGSTARRADQKSPLRLPLWAFARASRVK